MHLKMVLADKSLEPQALLSGSYMTFILGTITKNRRARGLP